MTTLGCLLIGLIVTAVFLMSKKSGETYPPVVDNCPDYWINTYYDKDSECKKSQYGCCPDNRTPQMDPPGTNCVINSEPNPAPQPLPKKSIGGCNGTQYGCCPDNNTPKRDSSGSNCLLSKV